MANDDVLVVGHKSLLCTAFLGENPDLSVRAHELEGPPDANWFEGVRCVINFAWDPYLTSQPYEQARDVDRALALRTREVGARYIMLSSRKVYAQSSQLGANENSPVEGVDAYGRNKLQVERSLQSILPEDKLVILRAANVIGFEYPRSRASFMGYMLTMLKREGFIGLTTSPFGTRDFISDAHFAKALRQFVDSDLSGVYNVGSGHPAMVGKLALWVLEGYGKGDLRASTANVDGEFFLDIERLQSVLPLAFTENDLRCFCIELGERLKHTE